MNNHILSAPWWVRWSVRSSWQTRGRKMNIPPPPPPSHFRNTKWQPSGQNPHFPIFLLNAAFRIKVLRKCSCVSTHTCMCSRCTCSCLYPSCAGHSMCVRCWWSITLARDKCAAGSGLLPRLGSTRTTPPPPPPSQKSAMAELCGASALQVLSLRQLVSTSTRLTIV